MDEACGGVSEPSGSTANVMEFDDEWQKTEFEANGTEYVQLLKDEIDQHRIKIMALENELKGRYSDEVRAQIAALMEDTRMLEEEATIFKERADELEKEMKAMEEGLKNDVADETNTLLAFKAMYEDAKRVRANRNPNGNIPVDIRLHSWRGIVGEKPDLSWNLKNVFHDQKKFFVGKYSFNCKAEVQLPSTPHPRRPFLQVWVKSKEQLLMVPQNMPTIFAVITSKESGESRVERLDVVDFDGSDIRYDRSRFACGEPAAIRVPCKGLGIKLYFELLWSTRELQSQNGILYWTVKNVSQLLRRDDRKLYSHRFVTDNGNGHIMQTVLYLSVENELNLYVVRHSSLGLAYSNANYVVAVIVFKPKRSEFKWIRSRRSDLKQTEIFVLGKLEDVVVCDDTFFCKILVRKAPTSA